MNNLAKQMQRAHIFSIEVRRRLKIDSLGSTTEEGLFSCSRNWKTPGEATPSAKMNAKSRRSLKDKISLKNSLVKETLSEFFATSLLITLGCGCIAQSVLSQGAAGNIITISAGFAMAVTMAVYVAGGVSGGHINPAVSFAMCLTGKLKWRKFPFYVLAQMLGAMAGAAAVFGVYYDALMHYTGGNLTVSGPNATAQIFATYPAPFLSTMNGFVDQVMATALLVIAIFAIFDSKNIGVPKGVNTVAVGLLIMLLCFSLGLNSGCAINPARDLGPRIFTAAAGWGLDVFRAGNSWWWIPVVGPMIGAAIGAFAYMMCIEIHHSKQSEDVKSEQNDGMYEKSELTSM
ncbi:LOW QUALITY PROTEIN: aquaporin-9 [Rhinatrema bivittatum]|uniref:LOW QUALITY PROTEIN: aquaporin-9 n=1 Tax=Rhinatrema bivittatum TaxID=194408 RepID=UPI001129A759|nr:LOW QUALITY PROTEIN: aquaporin-9 [Rhinatrema bivittatum]